MKTTIIILAVVIGLVGLLLFALFKIQDRSDDQSEETWGRLKAEQERDSYSPLDYAGRGLSTTHESVRRARGGR